MALVAGRTCQPHQQSKKKKQRKEIELLNLQVSAKKHHETSHLCTSKRNPNDFCPNTEQLRQGRLSQRQSISLVGNPVVDASQSANPQQPAPPT